LFRLTYGDETAVLEKRHCEINNPSEADLAVFKRGPSETVAPEIRVNAEHQQTVCGGLNDGDRGIAPTHIKKQDAAIARSRQVQVFSDEGWVFAGIEDRFST
jgi:hypothetical protein